MTLPVKKVSPGLIRRPSPRRQAQSCHGARGGGSHHIKHDKKNVSIIDSANNAATATAKVSFKPTVLVRPSLHVNDFLEHEVNAYWVNETDKDRIQEENMNTVTLMELGIPHFEQHCRIDHEKNNAMAMMATTTRRRMQTHKDLLCTRGLEAQTTTGSKIRRRVRQRARQVVLKEQEQKRQKNNDKSNRNNTTMLRNSNILDHRIALLYGYQSHDSQIRARRTGISDERALQERGQVRKQRHQQTPTFSSSSVDPTNSKLPSLPLSTFPPVSSFLLNDPNFVRGHRRTYYQRRYSGSLVRNTRVPSAA